MPNWCSNSLSVEGPKEILEEFYEKASGDHTRHTLSFNAFVPLPPEEEANWYNWHIDNWGTKWDTNAEDVLITKDTDVGLIYYSFVTAWGPPDIWLYKVAAQYPELTFELIYEENGAGFAGITKCTGGNVTTSDVYNYGTPGYREFVEEHFGEGYFEDDDEEDDAS